MLIWIASGSIGDEPTWNAASRFCAFSQCFPTGAGRVRRSTTWTPALFTPDITARLTRRYAAADSRVATTRAPRLRAVPSAAPKRTATSGVTSTLTRPDTWLRVKRRVDARDSQIRLSCSCDPYSASWYGQMRTPGDISHWAQRVAPA